MDRHPLGVGESQRQQHARAPVRHHQPQRPAQNRNQDALRQQLANDAYARRSQGRPDADFGAPVHAAHEEKVGDIRAGHQQHQRRDPRKQLQVGFVRILQILNSSAARRKHNVGAPQEDLSSIRIEILEGRELLP